MQWSLTRKRYTKYNGARKEIGRAWNSVWGIEHMQVNGTPGQRGQERIPLSIFCDAAVVFVRLYVMNVQKYKYTRPSPLR